MNILIYYQSSLPTVFMESLVQSFIEKGHRVFFLTISDSGPLHNKMKSYGASTFSYSPKSNKLMLYILHWWYLIRFCRNNKIDVVYSHLQYVNLIAVIAQYFIKAKVLPCRHHIDEVKQLGNRNSILMDTIINKLAEKLIVLSDTAADYMVSKEGVKGSKIVVIPLGYNFNLYEIPDQHTVKKIKEQYLCDLLLINASRMISTKRQICSIQTVKDLVKDGYNVKLLLTDQGGDELSLKKMVNEWKLEDYIFFVGYRTDLINYLMAADLILHPSIGESSNQVIKEGALCSKTGIVIKGVGDFDEYIVHKENGFLVSKENTSDEMVSIIKEYTGKKEELYNMGNRLKKVVLERFNITSVSEAYLNLSNV